MTQQLSSQAAVSEDLGFISTARIEAHNHQLPQS